MNHLGVRFTCSFGRVFVRVFFIFFSVVCSILQSPFLCIRFWFNHPFCIYIFPFYSLIPSWKVLALQLLFILQVTLQFLFRFQLFPKICLKNKVIRYVTFRMRHFFYFEHQTISSASFQYLRHISKKSPLYTLLPVFRGNVGEATLIYTYDTQVG